MLKSLLTLFNQSHIDVNDEEFDEELLIFCGIMFEAAAVDGQIDKKEIKKIKNYLYNSFKIDAQKAESVIKKCLEEVNGPNSLYDFSSKINKKLDYNRKIDLLEVLWEIILSDSKIHDFESNLMRRLAGLLYVSDLECGKAKNRVLKKLIKENRKT